MPKPADIIYTGNDQVKQTAKSTDTSSPLEAVNTGTMHVMQNRRVNSKAVVKQAVTAVKGSKQGSCLGREIPTVIMNHTLPANFAPRLDP